MKRLISMFLVLVMTVCACCAFAEGTAEAAEEPSAEQQTAAASETFVFRNGVTWGMSPDEVRACENRDEASFSEDGSVSALYYGYTDVSKYTADNLLYLFSDNKLVSAVYIFTNSWNDSTAKYITGALTELYGEPTEMTKEEISSEMNFYSGFDGSAITSAYGWTTDSALIRVATDSELDITYMDPSFTGVTSGHNTAGL